MNCSKCRKQLTTYELRKAVIEKDDSGRVVAIYHLKCDYLRKKHKRMGPDGKYLADSPTVYEQAARKQEDA